MPRMAARNWLLVIPFGMPFRAARSDFGMPAMADRSGCTDTLPAGRPSPARRFALLPVGRPGTTEMLLPGAPGKGAMPPGKCMKPPPLPPDIAPSGPARPAGPAGTLAVFTLAPGGGVNAKLDAAGRANEIEVKPIWNAGLDEPRAKTCTRSGRYLLASTAMLTRPMREPGFFGASTSW